MVILEILKWKMILGKVFFVSRSEFRPYGHDELTMDIIKEFMYLKHQVIYSMRYSQIQ